MADNPYNAVAEPIKQYNDMLPDWQMCDSLLGGTKAMRESRESYLPSYEAESPKDYETRLYSTFLYNMYRKAILVLVGKIFSKEIKLADDVPRQIQEWTENVDRQGRALNVFARILAEDGINRGKTHFLVDSPVEQADTKDEAQRRGLRPYWVHVPPDEIIGWREAVINGNRVLTQLRRRFTVYEEDGEWGTASREYVTVYERENDLVTYQNYTQDEDGNWHPIEDQAGALPVSYIPLVTVYTGQTGFMTAKPPMLDLAYKNVEHWQSSSDQRHILKWSRFAIPIIKGGDPDTRYVFGPSNAIPVPSDGDVYFAEHSGAAIESGFKDLEQLKEEMGELALEPMLRRPGNVTATDRAITESGNRSQLVHWAMALKDGLEQGLQYMAEFGTEQQGGSVVVDMESIKALEEEGDKGAIMDAQRQGIISRQVAFQELQRLGVVSSEVDYQEMQAQILSEQRSNPAFRSLAQNLNPEE